MAKIAVKCAILNDFFFENSPDMVQYLSQKFSNNLLYCFQEVDVKALEEERAEDSLKVFDTVDDSLQCSKQLSLHQTMKPLKQLLVFVCVTPVYPSMVLAKCLRHTSFIAPNRKPTSYGPSIKLS